jgi:K+-sensing histidine kinase KdpD
MTESIQYRSYVIDAEDGWYIAKSLDGGLEEICSRDLHRLMRAIDALWASLETGKIPQWFSDEALINLDQPVRAFRLPKLLKSAESVPSEVDPPRSIATIFLMIVAAVGIAMPVAIGLHQLVSTSEPAIIFTLAVIAIALSYGTVPAVLASIASMIVYNFSFVLPSMHFPVPGAEEIAYTAINIAISILSPWIFGTRKVISHKAATEPDRSQDTVLPYP